MSTWTICGNTLSPGEKRRIVLRVPMGGQPHAAHLDHAPEECADGGYEIPATLVCGRNPGKTLLVSASIHAGEYIGIPAVLRVANAIDPEKLSGNVIFLHCVNLSGVLTHHYREVPEDFFNLNSKYPGNAEGTPGERIAAWFVREMFPNIDFMMDLHGGSPEELMTPLVFFPHAHKVSETALNAVKALNIGYMLESYATTGQYSYAANFFDVPGFLLERGDGVMCTEDKLKADHDDIRLLMDHLGMYAAEEGTFDPDLERIIVHKTIYLESDLQGLWYPAVHCGQDVKKGEYLGRIEDFYGNLLKEYFAEDDGRVFYYTQGLAVIPGDALVTYGILSTMEDAFTGTVCTK